MLEIKKEIRREADPAGYVYVEALMDGGDHEFFHQWAENAAGKYIGDVDTARFLCHHRGIAPETISADHNVCSIGFCDREQQWYGWSHRALAGFGVGSTVEKGDCGYVPVDWDDFLRAAAAFWTEDDHLDVKAERGVDQAGKPVAKVTWIYADTIPNEALRGTIGGADMYPPDQFGRGEWTAATLDDAKQMAIDFARDVA